MEGEPVVSLDESAGEDLAVPVPRSVLEYPPGRHDLSLRCVTRWGSLEKLQHSIDPMDFPLLKTFLAFVAIVVVCSLPPGSLLAQQDKPSGMPGKETWPANSVPKELPVYSAGKIVNHGAVDASSFLIYAEAASSEVVDRYVALLTRNGWTTNTGKRKTEAKFGPYTVEVSFKATQHLVAIRIVTASTDRSWPTEQLPFLPVFTKGRSTDFVVNDYDISIGITGTNEAEMVAYESDLRNAGWTGSIADGGLHYRRNEVKKYLLIEDQGDGEWHLSVSTEE